MIEKSTAAVLVSPNKPLEMREFTVPKLGMKSVLVESRVTGICGTDVHDWRGHTSLPYPVILGHENVAEVIELGQEVTTDSIGREVRRGDRVFWRNGKPCSHCYYCIVQKDFTSCVNRRPVSCSEFPYLVGGYAEYAYLSERTYFLRIPDGVDDRSAIAFGCGGPTITKALELAGGIRPNENVVVQGIGPVGLYAVLLARISGAKNVIAIGAPEVRLNMARKLGANYTIDIVETKATTDRVAKVNEITEGRGADLTIEATGVPSAIPEGIELTGMNGRYIMVGVYSDVGSVLINPTKLVRKNLRITGSKFSEPRHLYSMLETIERVQRHFPISEVVTHEFTLSESTKALEEVEKQNTVKAILVPSRK